MRTFSFLVALIFVSTAYASVDPDPEPNYTVMIPMRDGLQLPADVYLPEGKTKSLPCILLRTPAGRRSPIATRFAPMAQQGYAVVIQGTRSSLDQEGKTFPYMSDGWGELQDGYDTVEWLAKDSLTNGRIGTLGASAMGITQLLLAPSAPKGLKCQYIGVAASNLYHQAIFPGGQMRKSQVEGWLGLYARDPGVQCYVCNQIFYNDFWKSFDTSAVAHRVQAPALHYGGWYDTFLPGTLDAFVARQYRGGEGARGHQKLLIGPWQHFWPLTTKLGDFEVPKTGYYPPVDTSMDSWFAHYLKGVPNGAENLPTVTYYVMGPFDGSPSSGHVWRHSDTWPVPAINTPFFFRKDQALSSEDPNLTDETISYHYNPHDPVPTLGGNNLFLEAGPKDQSPIEARDDVILFTTSPLADDLEMTGPIIAKIWFSSDQVDTDLCLRLTDVYPDGKSILVTDGIRRIGLHATEKGLKHLEEPIEVEIDLSASSLVFAKGHQIRVSVSSSNYPRYEKNTNVGLLGRHTGSSTTAHNTIYIGPNHPSQITLPLTRRGDRWLIQ